MLSNCGHDENGKYHGGAAGDQTGTEWQIRTWYSYPWTAVFRYPDTNVANVISNLAIKAANNNNIGYDQDQRTTYWTQLKSVNYDPSLITTKCEADCSAGAAANVKAAGYLCGIKALQNVSEYMYTGNCTEQLTKAGFQKLTGSTYTGSEANLKAGDILLAAGHHVATEVGGASVTAVSTSAVTTDSEGVLINKLNQFLACAESQVGSDGTWTWKTSGQTKGQAWSASFIDACAITVDLADQIVVKGTWGASELVRQSVSKGLGTFYQGPYFGKTISPKEGDIIQFRWYSVSGDKYTCHHIGIIKSVDSNGTIHTIEGNVGGSDNYDSKVRNKSYSKTNKCISGLFRPDWDSLGCVTYGDDLYDEYCTREDSILREFGYWKSTAPVTSSTNLRCSVINYTTELGSFFEGAIGNYTTLSSNSVSVDVSGVTGNCKTIMSLLLGKGFNTAGAVGICANIYAESSYNPAAVSSDGNYSYGLCQWTFGRRTNMVNYVGSNWATNISGQIDFLEYELKTSYKGVYNYVMAVPCTVAGAQDAAEYFVRKFEVPSNIETRVKERRQYAVNIWNQVVIQV